MRRGPKARDLFHSEVNEMIPLLITERAGAGPGPPEPPETGRFGDSNNRNLLFALFSDRLGLMNATSEKLSKWKKGFSSRSFGFRA